MWPPQSTTRPQCSKRGVCVCATFAPGSASGLQGGRPAPRAKSVDWADRSSARPMPGRVSGREASQTRPTWGRQKVRLGTRGPASASHVGLRLYHNMFQSRVAYIGLWTEAFGNVGAG